MTLFDIKYDDFKREDTTNVIAITLYTDGKQPITPNANHTWKAKVSKEDKYVGEYPVTISGNTIKLSSSNLTRLPNGDYGLELWETYDGSTTIYPSAGVMEFRVHRNANDTLGTVDPTTDINGIIDDLHKAGQNIKVVATNTLPAGSKASVTQSITNGENQLTFNIPQGNKGDKGDVGPAPTLKVGTVTKLGSDQAPTVALTGGNGTYTLNMGIPQGAQGETNATATNALNLANGVDNKVTEIQSNGGGRNLVIGTADQKCDGPNKGIDCSQISLDTWKSLRGQWITISCDMSWTGFTRSADIQNRVGYEVGLHYSDGTVMFIDNWYTPTDSEVNKDFRFGRSWQLPDKELISTEEGWLYNQVHATTCVTSKLMIEKGTVAHDWSPAPEDIQTQLDTLKEAVKKLGGVTDAILGSIGINHNLITATSKITWNATLGKLSSPEIGTDRFTFIDSTVRGLWASKVAPIANGKKYILRCKIRANESMQLTQFGNTDAIFDQTMITTDWQTVETIFDSAKGVNVYADGKSGDWFEISDQVLIEAGGVAQTNLLADWATSGSTNNATIANGILSLNPNASTDGRIDFYKKDVVLVPGHTYKLSFMARGNGIVRNYLYDWTNKGATSATDSVNLTKLADDWREFSQAIKYDPTSDNSSNTKHFLFRWMKSDCASLTVQISDLSLVDITE